jgi:flavorubredoxin
VTQPQSRTSEPWLETTAGRRLPRELAPGIYWLGDCAWRPYKGELVHSYHSVFFVAGEEASVIVDTGHPKDWAVLQTQVNGLLESGVASPTYIFPTHAEVPHAANLGRWLQQFPDAQVIGDVRDYHLFFPEAVGRLVALQEGDRIPLGGTDFVLKKAVIRDLVTSLWGFDTARGALFPGDGFAYMHEHLAGQCGKTAEEIPDLPIPELTAIFAQYALYWTRFTDLEPHIRELDELFTGAEPITLVAPSHGAPLLDPRRTVELIKAGLRLGAARAEH